MDTTLLKNIDTFFEQFPDNQSCVQHLIKLRWGNDIVCPYCESHRVSFLKKSKRLKCKECARKFNPTVKTIFHGSHTTLGKWYYLICLMSASKNTIKTVDASVVLGIQPQTVSRMRKRIIQAYDQEDNLIIHLCAAIDVLITEIPSW